MARNSPCRWERTSGISSVERLRFRRLTFTTTPEYNPAWMPDSRHVIFDSRNEAGLVQIMKKAADGAGPSEVIVPAPAGYPNTISGDSRFLVYHTAAQQPIAMLWPLTTGGPVRPLVPVKTPTALFNAETSPDGRWIAYQSSESGRFEIFVRPFPETDKGQWQVSSSGGAYPHWAPGGRELTFIAGGGALSSVAVAVSATFAHELAASLFQAGQYHTDAARNYDVSRDGKRFLFVKNVSAANRPSMVVVSGWIHEVSAKMKSH